jgi:predicted transcriptional regulator
MPAITKSRTSSVKIDAHASDKLSELAFVEKRTPHYLMREAISFYAKQEHIKQKAILDTKASRESYQ